MCNSLYDDDNNFLKIFHHVPHLVIDRVKLAVPTMAGTILTIQQHKIEKKKNRRKGLEVY